MAANILVVPLFALSTLLLYCVRCSDDSAGILVLAQVLYRHGDRSPVTYFPTDKYKGSWPQGEGQLSTIGMQQHYHLGQYMRQRYMFDYHLLNTTYIHYQINVRSTNYDRTLMSAYSNLAGLYPPTGSQRWSEHILWQPIPVHAMPRSEDKLFQLYTSCPEAEKLRDELGIILSIKKEIQKNKEFYSYMLKHTGMNETFRTHICDSFTCELAHNLSLPNWATATWDDGTPVHVKTCQLGYAAQLKYLGVNKNSTTRRLQRSPLLKEMIKNMNETVTGSGDQTDKRTKLFVYSAHDSTLTAVLIALNVFNRINPPYASSVMVELYNASGQYSVQLHYRNDSSKEPLLLQIPGCNLSCPYDKFLSLTHDVIPVDWYTECNGPSSDVQFGLPVIILVVAIATSVMLVGLIIMWRRTRRLPYQYYKSVPTKNIESDILLDGEEARKALS